MVAAHGALTGNPGVRLGDMRGTVRYRKYRGWYSCPGPQATSARGVGSCCPVAAKVTLQQQKSRSSSLRRAAAA